MFSCLICFSIRGNGCGSTVLHSPDTLAQGRETGSDVSADIQALIANRDVVEESGEITESSHVLPCPADPEQEQQPQSGQSHSTHGMFSQMPRLATTSKEKQEEDASAGAGQNPSFSGRGKASESPIKTRTQNQDTESLLCCIKCTNEDTATVSQCKSKEGGGCCGSPDRHDDCIGTNSSSDSPSLKLQALEGDSGPPPESLDPQAQDNLPAQPLPMETQHLYLSHTPPLPPSLDQHAVESSQPVHLQSPSLSASSLVLSTALCSEDLPGEGGLQSPPVTNPSPLLSRLTPGNSPVPSPRCPSLTHSLRFNLDPETAPSPPCSQHICMARCSVHIEPDEGSVSISVLNRHIHTLRKRIRRFEEHFEQERHYKPAHNDKTAHPEVAKLMKELVKSRKQLKEMKLRQLLQGLGGLSSTSETCRTNAEQRETGPTGTELQQINNNSNTKPSLEETVNTITNRLKERRRELGLPDSVKEMSHFQMSMEKTCIQKCLLYFEDLHGRPSTRQERTLMKPFYDRYRLLKQQLSSAFTTAITTIEEEEGSDEEHFKQQSPKQQTLWLKTPKCVSSEESQISSPPETSETPLVSPLEEMTSVQSQIITMATLHEASRQELLDHLRTVRFEKRRLHQALRQFEEHFYTQTGRLCQKEDRGPMAEEYCQYKNLKAKLRLLEALLSKQDSTKMS